MIDSSVTIVIALVCAVGLLGYLWWASGGKPSELITNPTLRKTVPIATAIAFALAIMLSTVFSSVRRKLRQGKVNKSIDEYNKKKKEEKGKIEDLNKKAEKVEADVKVLEIKADMVDESANKDIISASDHHETADEHRSAGEDALAKANRIRDRDGI